MTTDDAILSNLITRLRGLTTAHGYSCNAGANVWQELEHATALFARPCLCVYQGDLTSGIDGDTPPSLGELNVFMPVIIEGFVDDVEAGTAGADLARDLVTIIRQDTSFGGHAEYLAGQQIKSTASVQDGGDDGFFSLARIEFTIFYVEAA